MVWKDWLKWGIVLLTINLIIQIIVLIISDEKGIIFGLANFPMVIPMTILLRGLGGTSESLGRFIIILVSLVFWFGIGSLIGFLVGKIKHKK